MEALVCISLINNEDDFSLILIDHFNICFAEADVKMLKFFVYLKIEFLLIYEFFIYFR